jgi:hypothetical protein
VGWQSNPRYLLTHSDKRIKQFRFPGHTRTLIGKHQHAVSPQMLKIRTSYHQDGISAISRIHPNNKFTTDEKYGSAGAKPYSRVREIRRDHLITARRSFWVTMRYSTPSTFTSVPP